MLIENLTRPNETPQDQDLLRYTYDNGIVVEKRYIEEKAPTQDEIIAAERQWRDSELKGTDWIVPVTDHPQHAAYLVYREELRNYPQQPDFPNGQRPIKP
jgi:hypothetical protein